MTPLTDQQQLNLRIKCAEDAGWTHLRKGINYIVNPNGITLFYNPLEKDFEDFIPSLTHETLHGVIKRMDYSQECIFVDELCDILIISRRDFSNQDCLDILSAPLPTIALCVAKAKGWEI